MRAMVSAAVRSKRAGSSITARPSSWLSQSRLLVVKINMSEGRKGRAFNRNVVYSSADTVSSLSQSVNAAGPQGRFGYKDAPMRSVNSTTTTTYIRPRKRILFTRGCRGTVRPCSSITTRPVAALTNLCWKECSVVKVTEAHVRTNHCAHSKQALQ